MNELRTTSHHTAPPLEPEVPAPASGGAGSLPVGDVLVRRDDTGYRIFNYRGEPVLEAPVRTSAEATRLAEEIVSPWHGRVRTDELPGH